MKLFLATLAVLAVACKSTATNSGVLGPLTSAGCDLESGLTSSFGAALAGATGASDPVACGAALQSALGNANLCATAVPSASVASQGVAKAAVAAPKYATLGDIPASALHLPVKGAQIKAQVVAKLGIIGSIACPIADSAIVGLLTGAIPAACSGSTPLTASAANAALVTACTALLSGLP